MAIRKYLIPCFFIFFCHIAVFGSHAAIIDSLKKVLKKTIQDTSRVKLLNDIGAYFLGDREFSKATTYLTNGYNLAEKIDYKQGLVVALNRTGLLYFNQSLHSKALECYDKALVIAKKINDKKGEADVRSNMSIVYSSLGNYARSLEYCLSALKIREAIKDEKGICRSMMAVANIYYLQSDDTTALNYYLNLLTLKDVKNERYFYAEVLHNTGLVYLALKQYQKALDYFYEAIKIDKEIGDKQGVALAYTNIGFINYIIGNYKKALEVTLSSYEILDQLNDKRSVAEVYGEIGVIYDSLKQPEKAFDYFKKQLTLSKEIQNRFNTQKAYLFISNHYRLLHKYKEAYEYHKLYKTMEDSIKSESSIKALAELETKFETERKEKEIELLKTEQQLQSAENTKQKQLIYGSFIIAIVFSLFLFLLYNRQQLKKKALLEKKNFELERNALSAQMNPHFIFNSLGSISGFISENDKDKAIEYLGIFSRLIRHNLEQSREQLVSVLQETQMLRSYLFLQQLRYNDKFDFKIELDENMDTAIALPPMFIQPFVENAILHGIIPKNEKGNIVIRFYLNGEELICEVQDDGIGKAESLKRKSANSMHHSLAMTITEERMQIINSMNKEKISIITTDISDVNGHITGTLVKLIFPIDYI